MRLRKLAGAGTPMARSAIGSIAIRVAAPVLNLAVSIVLVRLAGPHDYGIYIYCLSMAGLVLQPVTGGISTTLIRHLAAYRVRSEWALLRGVLQRGLQSSIAISLMLIFIGLSFVYFSIQVAPDSRPVFFMALVLIPLYAFSAFCSAVLRGLHHVIWGQFPDQIVAPVILLLLAAVNAGIGLQMDALMLVWNQVISAVVVLLLGVRLISSRLPPEIKGIAPLYEDKYWVRGVIPLVLLISTQKLGTEISVIMLGQINGVANSGIFRLCVRGAELVSFVLIALNVTTAPTFSRLHAQGDLLELSRLTAKTSRIALFASLPVALPLIFAGDWVLRFLYGPDLASGAPALAILSFGQLLCVVAGPVGSLLMMTGYQRDAFKGSIAALIVAILLAVILIPLWGLNGAATATASGMVLRNGINCWHVFRRLHIKPLLHFNS